MFAETASGGGGFGLFGDTTNGGGGGGGYGLAGTVRIGCRRRRRRAAQGSADFVRALALFTPDRVFQPNAAIAAAPAVVAVASRTTTPRARRATARSRS